VPHARKIVTALLACVSIAAAFRDGMAFLLANARRSHPRRDRKTGRLRAVSLSSENGPKVITYVLVLAAAQTLTSTPA
jgi:hypothetical protein